MKAEIVFKTLESIPDTHAAHRHAPVGDAAWAHLHPYWSFWFGTYQIHSGFGNEMRHEALH